MKAVLQVVQNCTLTIDDSLDAYSHIDKGVMLLLGVGVNDTEEDCDKLVKKVAGLRIFNDKDDKMNLSCIDPDVNGKFMVVSQFTLYANSTHGKRPDMFDAARPEKAIPLYERFVSLLNDECRRITGKSDESFVVTGKFGAHMRISFTNVGPKTFIIESEKLK
jgi:D-tyrosyl-tRNA(Tyr) deacylase